MAYESVWWRLSEAVTRVIEASGRTQEEVQTDICKAIKDGTVRFQCKLGTRLYGSASEDILGGSAFSVPDIKPDDFDWENSRPKKAWIVRRESYKPHGHWDLQWIELCRPDVTKHLCPVQNRGESAQRPLSRPRRTSKPKRERAQHAIHELWPSGPPSQAELLNKELYKRVGKKLKENGLGDVSPSTILRAAGRRK